MNAHQPMTRKYRPQTFSAVCHQEAIVTTLKNALQTKALAQSYLFCGTRGTGKTTLARLLAKALNCENLSSECEPCNQCQSCLEISKGASLDVIEIDGASNRGIDDIRQINETVGYAPSSSKWKIYIIDEVHMLTKEAFNALLKTLEEPPPRVKFFFATTEPHKVLSTITSRCQRFTLSRISNEQIAKKLAFIAEDLELSLEKESLHLIAELADGSMRDAESLFDQVACYAQDKITLEATAEILGITPKKQFFALDQAVQNHDLNFAFELAQDIFDSGKDLKHFLDLLINHYRMILRLHLGRTTKQENYMSAKQIYSQSDCLSILDYLIKWVQLIPASPFKRIDLEMVLLHIIRIKQRIPIDTLITRLTDLEQKLSSDTPAPQTTPEPIQKAPTPEPNPAPIQKAPTPEPNPAPIQKAPTPEPNPAPIQKAPTPEPNPAPIQQAPTPEPNPAPIQQAPTPEPNPAPIQQAPTPEPNPAPIQQAPTPEPNPAPIQQAPTPEPAPEPIQQAPTPEPAPEPIQQAPTPEPNPAPIQQTQPTPEPALHTPAPAPSESNAQKLASSIVQPTENEKHKSHYDSLLQFAAVELNGTVQK